MARPSDYSDALAAKICALIAEGMSLRAICARDDMPCKTAVINWLAAHEEFAIQYARAREAQADALFEECLEIADETKQDFVINADGDLVPNNEAIQRSRLRVDTRKWMAGKLRPKVYGEKYLAEHTGKDGGPLVVEIVKFSDPADSLT